MVQLGVDRKLEAHYAVPVEYTSIEGDDLAAILDGSSWELQHGEKHIPHLGEALARYDVDALG